MTAKKGGKKKAPLRPAPLTPAEFVTVSVRRLATTLGLPESKLRAALSTYNKIMGARVDSQIKSAALELASELPDARDIGAHFAALLTELGPVESLGQLTTIKGIGRITLRNVTLALSEAQPAAALEQAAIDIEDGAQFAPAPAILPLGASSQVIEEPWFTGVLPGEIIALEGQIAPGSCSSNERLFFVDPELAPDIPAALPLQLEGFPVGALPNGPVTMMGIGSLRGGIQPLLFLPPVGLGGVLLAFSPIPVIVRLNIRVFRAVLALKEQVRQVLIELFKCFGFDPANPVVTRADKGSQLLKIMALKLAIAKEKLDLKTFAAALKALEACQKKLEKAGDNKQAAKLRRERAKLDDVMTAKQRFLSFTLEPNLCGVPSPDPDEALGLDDWDRKLVEKIIKLLKALEKSVGEIKRTRKKMGDLSPGADKGEDASGKEGPSADELGKALKKIDEDFKKRLKKFKEEQKKNEKEWKKKIEKDCKEGKTDQLLRDLNMQLAAIVERNRALLGAIRGGLIPEELAAVKKAKRLSERMSEFMELEKDVVEDAIKREKEAIRRAAENPELHAKKLKLFLELRDTVNDQLEAFDMGGGVLSFDDDEVPTTLDGLLEKKKDEAEEAKDNLKDAEKKLDKLRKKLAG